MCFTTTQVTTKNLRLDDSFFIYIECVIQRALSFADKLSGVWRLAECKYKKRDKFVIHEKTSTSNLPVNAISDMQFGVNLIEKRKDFSCHLSERIHEKFSIFL